MCVSDKKDYDQSNKIHAHRDDQIEELNRKQEELDAWKKEEEERHQLELDEQKAKKQEAKDSIVAQSCTCTWECGDRNDGTVCFRKCCNGEFGGNPNAKMPVVQPPVTFGAQPAAQPAPGAQGAPAGSGPAVNFNPLAQAIAALPNPLANLPNPFA